MNIKELTSDEIRQELASVKEDLKAGEVRLQDLKKRLFDFVESGTSGVGASKQKDAAS